MIPSPTRRLLLSAVLIACSATPCAAQSPDHSPLVLDMVGSTTALSLGGAFPLRTPDSDAIFYNPAVLDEADGISGSIARFGTGGTLATASGSGDWWGGGIAVGLMVLDYGAPNRDPNHTDIALGDILEPGPVGASEIMAIAGYGREVGSVRLGLSAKWIARRFAGVRATTGAVDLGAATDIGPVRIGLSALNLGQGLQFGGVRTDLSSRIVLGASSRSWAVGPLDLAGAGAVERRADGEYIPGGGLEIRWWPVQGRTFVGRIGARRVPEEDADPLTFGGSFVGDDLSVDYAYQSFDGADAVHRFTVRWR